MSTRRRNEWQEKSSIFGTKLLIVEGRTPLNFFIALLRVLGKQDDVEVRDFESIEKLSSYLRTLVVTPGFQTVTSLGVIRDAEDDAASAFASVCGSLTRAQLDVPKQPMEVTLGAPRISIFILPDNQTPGMLETLCLRAVEKDVVTECIDQYFICLQKNGLPLPKNMPKAQVQAYLASRERPGLLLGEAASRGYIAWHSPVFDQIKQFLLSL